MSKFLVRLCLTSSIAAILACSSTPPVTEFPITADPKAELDRMDSEINIALGNQVNVLAPTNFEMATKSLAKAREARAKEKKQTEVLHDIAVSQAYLNKANEVAKVSNQLLGGVTRERRNALIVEAPIHMKKEFFATDDDLKDVTKKIENNDTADAVKARGNLENRYSDLEVQAIIKAKLGAAKNTMEQATKEGAKKLTPQTLAWAQKKLGEDEANIINNRHNQSIIEIAATDANASSQRLLSMVRQAKSSAGQNPEQLASHLEANQNAANLAAAESTQKLNQSKEILAQSKSDSAENLAQSRSDYEANLAQSKSDYEKKLAETKTDLEENKDQLADKKDEVAILTQENDKLEDKGRIEKEYLEANNLFTKDEAEVYKQGNTLLLRLKGLSFPKGQSIITVNNYALLAKVQKVIKESNLGNIVIEGHADSTGAKATNEKLSSARASAVVGYLTANNAIQDDMISAKGFGDSKPIASNKTQLGRAQNRRVDVILSSMQLK